MVTYFTLRVFSLTDRSRFLLVPVASSVAAVARSVVDRCLGTVITDRALLSAVKTNSPQMSAVVAVSGSNSECTRSQKSWSRVALFCLSCLVIRKISLSSPSSLTSPSSTTSLSSTLKCVILLLPHTLAGIFPRFEIFVGISCPVRFP